MRVLEIAPPYGAIGPELVYSPIVDVAARHASELQQHGHEIVLSALEGSVVPGVEIIESPADRPDVFHAQLGTVLPRVMRGEFDVIQVHNAETLLGLLGAGATDTGAQLVATLHGQGDRVGPRYSGLIDPAKGVHALAISSSQAESLRRYFDVAGVVFNGVDTETYKPADPVTKGDFAFILSRITDDKGITRSIHAARSAEMRLIIAGVVLPQDEGYFIDQVVPLLAGGVVDYIGPLTDREKLPYLQQARAVLQLSKFEEVGSLTALEAMSCGTPVVASARGCFPEMIVEGVSGFASDDIELCSQGLRLAYGLDTEQVRGVTIARYSWRNTGIMLAAVLEKIVRPDYV